MYSRLTKQGDMTMNTTIYPAHLARECKPLPTPGRDEQRALAFAHQHDWGRNARLRCNSQGEWFITSLIDAYTINGAYHEELVAVPATVAALREFGNY